MKLKHWLMIGGGLAAGVSAAVAVSAGAASVSALNRRRGRPDTPRPNASLAGSVVLITGGSRGLGLATAREFAAAGCHLALCARDAAELDRARADIESRGAKVITVPCDLTDQEQVEQMVRRVLEEYGRIDVLVNNAGVIQVGPLDNMTLQDFETAMSVMFWGTLYPTLAVLPDMRQRKAGRIVNITSIGGKVSVPHLLPYSCAKFATVGLSEGLRAELAPAGIRVTTIVPGLMRTGSHVNAQFKGNAPNEFAWFSLGASMPVASISAESAAKSIVRATASGTAERILSLPANILARVHGLVPELTLPILALVNRYVLPKPGSQPLTTGREAQRQLNSRLFETLTAFGRSAGKSLNESTTS